MCVGRTWVHEKSTGRRAFADWLADCLWNCKCAQNATASMWGSAYFATDFCDDDDDDDSGVVFSELSPANPELSCSFVLRNDNS